MRQHDREVVGRDYGRVSGGGSVAVAFRGYGVRHQRAEDHFLIFCAYELKLLFQL